MTTFVVPDMSCGHCKAAVEKAVAKLDAQARVTVDLDTKIVEVEGTPTPEAVVAALDAEGYPASVRA
ncbi:MAG: hypothetical protein GC146_17045 [Limimaricola sp.]|uniref:heavy-metal-associated domain-containing protein n=1 Tax=Limimaricola sp. TaxID=2211665 RepID=UPI001DD75417|nr:heavy-metal-associated domain-containing protein [Limimaricola sp.]MBI1418920.1 hypothetical protein [Limimaricola sp.]